MCVCNGGASREATAAKHRAGCAALPRTVPRTEPRHAKLSACAGCQAAHRGGEPPRAMARRRDGDIAPYRHYTRMGCAAITPAFFARALPTRITHARGGSPPSPTAITLAKFAPHYRTPFTPSSAPPVSRGAVPLRYGAMLGRYRPWGLPTPPPSPAHPRHPGFAIGR